jgi:hypothetical protein
MKLTLIKVAGAPSTFHPYLVYMRDGLCACGLIRQYFGLLAQDILAAARLVRLARARR